MYDDKNNRKNYPSTRRALDTKIIYETINWDRIAEIFETESIIELIVQEKSGEQNSFQEIPFCSTIEPKPVVIGVKTLKRSLIGERIGQSLRDGPS